MEPETDLEELWHDLLTDPDHTAFRHARRHARFWKHIPGDPRCKMCKTPLGGPATPLLKLTSRAPSPNNPNFCNACNTWTKANPGGAEVDLTFLFADVRGVHTGESYVGAVGVEGSKQYDVTALGDTVNAVARLASAAGQGEVLVSERAVELSGLNLGAAEPRLLQLKGRSEALAVRVLQFGG